MLSSEYRVVRLHVIGYFSDSSLCAYSYSDDFRQQNILFFDIGLFVITRIDLTMGYAIRCSVFSHLFVYEFWTLILVRLPLVSS